MMKLDKIITLLDEKIENPMAGLPEEVFLLVSRLTPMPNVDLLIRDENGRILLTWRNDEYLGPGWHVPGGMIRYKETAFARIKAVAKNELKTQVRHGDKPLEINELICKSRRNRAHCISLLYDCTLISALPEELKYTVECPKPGQYAWFKECPDNILEVHKIYRKYFNQ